MVDCVLGCASLTVDDRWRRLTGRTHTVPRLHCCRGGWRRSAVLVQGSTHHLGGHAYGCRSALGGTEGAILASSWRRRVRNNWVEGSSGPASRHRNQAGMLLCWGRMVRLLSIVGSWSGIGWMRMERLLVVVGICWWRCCRGMGGIWLRRRGRAQRSAVWRGCYMMLREVVLLLLLLMVVVVVVSTVGIVRDGCFVGSRSSMARNGGVALLLRLGSIVTCRWVHGRVRLHWTILIGGRSSAVRR